MLRYILKRLLLMVPVLMGVSLLIFGLQFIAPGNPAQLILGDQATQVDIDAFNTKYGLDNSFLVQYTSYIWDIVTKGDFGVSYRTGKNITSQVIERWPTTFLLATSTTLISVIIGMFLGMLSAKHRNTWIDSTSRVFGMLGISLPSFWFGLLLIILFGVKLRWLPVSGFYGPKYWVLPALTLGVLGSAAILRITRSAMLDNMQQDFVRTARAKGQTEKVIMRHHILRNALIPIITSIGARFAHTMGGAMVLEQVFAISGLGKLMVDSINARDFPQLRASVLLVAATVSIINLIVDIAYAYADPRVKASFIRSASKKFKVAKRQEVAEA
jgi:peptide/nickel transport system permease protein